MEMKNKEGNGKQSGGGEDDDDDQEQNKDMKLFGDGKGGNKRKGNFAHQKGFANKSFARKRKRVA